MLPVFIFSLLAWFAASVLFVVKARFMDCQYNINCGSPHSHAKTYLRFYYGKDFSVAHFVRYTFEIVILCVWKKCSSSSWKPPSLEKRRVLYALSFFFPFVRDGGMPPQVTLSTGIHRSPVNKACSVGGWKFCKSDICIWCRECTHWTKFFF